MIVRRFVGVAMLAVLVMAVKPLAIGAGPDPEVMRKLARLTGRASSEGSFGQVTGVPLVIHGARKWSRLGPKLLKVDLVDGKPLPQPVEIWVDNVKRLPLFGRVTLEGIERVYNVGVPSLGEMADARYFVVTRVVAPDSIVVLPAGN